MAVEKARGILLDIDYLMEEKSIIRLFIKTKKKTLVLRDPSFEPYFYLVVSGNAREAAKKIMEEDFYGVKVTRVEVVKKKLSPEKEPREVLKLFFNSTKEVKEMRNRIKELPYYEEKREYDIPFTKRYLIDRDLQPMSEVEVEFEGSELRSIRVCGDGLQELKAGAFDIETLSGLTFSDPSKDPIIMASFTNGKKSVVFCTKKIEKKYAVLVRDEKELIERLIERIRELDIVVTYNGDNFDFPYIKERAKRLGLKVEIGVDGSGITVKRKGMDNAVKIKGRQHIDSFQIVQILNRFGIVNLVKMDLEAVDKQLFGEKKEKIHASEINEIWHSGKGLERLAEYNKLDSEVALRIAKEYLPLFVEIGKLVNQTPFDVTRSGAGILVEAFLIKKAFAQGVLIPNKPSEEKVRMRIMQPIKGGYVREPKPGLHENLAVLDFTSLHPTIIISHNISPDTVNCNHKECEKNVSPEGQHFCIKRKGFLSANIEEIFHKRKELKDSLKKLKKGSREFNLVYARQYSLKIILNSSYGTLAFPRFRWYNRDCARAVTAWSRKYVKWVSERAEEEGFETIYGDTDSAFIKIPKGKTQTDVKEFVEKINSELPGVMNLELEGFFKRGIFVTKKSGKEAAKKRYALIDFNGNLKIVGFEYVRRDWALIAKETQRKVIEAVLSEGNPAKAVQIVRETIKKLKSGKMEKRKLVILTQIKKPIAKYESIGPHIAAAKKAIAKGKPLGEGSIIGYIVTRSGKSISGKAQLEEYVAEGNYDAEYYIKHQVIPAVIRIIAELGYSEEDLIEGGKQSSLNSFM